MSIIGYLNRKLRKKVKIPIPYGVDESKILDGRIAIITGGGSGIGFSIAEAFLHHGAKVIIVGRNEKKLIEACDKLSQISLFTEYICIDISNVADIKDKIQLAFEKYGKIDILVNSAGKHYTEEFGKVSEGEFTNIMETNIKGTYFITQTVCNIMIENRIHGNILNVSSSSGIRPAWGPYHMSKWALNGMTKGFADKVLKYGIVVNAVAPGQTVTPMLNVDKNDIDNEPTMLERYIMPTEIANVAVFLVSDLGRIIVGDTIYASGGSGIVNSHR